MAEWKSNKEKASISELAGDVTTIAFHAKGIELRAGGRSYYAHMQPIATREARCILHASGSSNRFRTPPPGRRGREASAALFSGGVHPRNGARGRRQDACCLARGEIRHLAESASQQYAQMRQQRPKRSSRPECVWRGRECNR